MFYFECQWTFETPRLPNLTLDSSFETSWPETSAKNSEKSGWSQLGVLGSFEVKIPKFSNLDKLYTKMKLLVQWLRKSGSWGHRPQIGGIWGQIPKNLQTRTNVYQNEALGPVITKKWVPRSLDPKLGLFGVTWGYLGSN